MEDDAIKLKQALVELGAQEDEVDDIIKDVSEVISAKYLSEYVSILPESDLKQALISMPEDQLQSYIEQNKDKLPTFSEDRYSQIAKETWIEYFDFMRQQGL
jgi:hypothetical protein